MVALTAIPQDRSTFEFLKKHESQQIAGNNESQTDWPNSDKLEQ